MDLSILIVDDEPLARRRLERLVEEEAGLVLAGTCAGGSEAIDALCRLAPDLVLLDVAMPEVGGFDVIEAVGPERMPEVIFVTAHGDHALRAFEVHALDYLLKPFTDERFRRSIAAARERIAGPGGVAARRLRVLLEELREPRGADRLLVREPESMRFVPTHEIRWIDAADNYVVLRTDRGSFRQRGTLASLEERLDPRRFVRIHRSTIVNLDRIREIAPTFHGDCVVVLDCGQRLAVGRSYKDRLLSASEAL